MGSAVSASGLRMAGLVGTLSLSADLCLGQPLEHVTRSCLLAVRLGELLGLDAGEREAIYYTALLAWVGCTADSHEVVAQFGDDVALRASSYDVDFTGLPLLGFLVWHAGAGRSPLSRVRVAAGVLGSGGRAVEGALAAHGQVTGQLVDRLGLGERVQRRLRPTFARSDGKGQPSSTGGRCAYPLRAPARGRMPGACAARSW